VLDAIFKVGLSSRTWQLVINTLFLTTNGIERWCHVQKQQKQLTLPSLRVGCSDSEISFYLYLWFLRLLVEGGNWKALFFLCCSYLISSFCCGIRFWNTLIIIEVLGSSFVFLYISSHRRFIISLTIILIEFEFLNFYQCS